jgi:hypothetical protein
MNSIATHSDLAPAMSLQVEELESLDAAMTPEEDAFWVGVFTGVGIGLVIAIT